MKENLLKGAFLQFLMAKDDGLLLQTVALILGIVQHSMVS